MRKIRFPGNLYKNATLFENFLIIRLMQTSNKWRRRFYGTDGEKIHVLDRLTQGILVKNSTLPHPDTGPGLFAAREISKETVVRYWVFGRCRPDQRTTQYEYVRKRETQLIIETFRR